MFEVKCARIAEEVRDCFVRLATMQITTTEYRMSVSGSVKAFRRVRLKVRNICCREVKDRK